MKPTDIMEALGDVPPDLIEAAFGSPAKHHRFVLKYLAAAGSIAACLAVTAGIYRLSTANDGYTSNGEIPAVTELPPQSRTAEADTTHAITEQTITMHSTTTDTARTAAAEPEGRTNFTTDGKGAAAQSSAPPAPDTTVTITTTSAANTTTATATTTTEAAATTTTTALPLNTVCYTPPFYKWHDFWNGDWTDGIRQMAHWQKRESLVLDIYPNLEFGWSNMHDDVIEIVENGESTIILQWATLWSVYFADITGDGYPEMCFTGHELPVQKNEILVYDLVHQQQYVLPNPEEFEYYLTSETSELCVHRQLKSIGNADEYLKEHYTKEEISNLYQPVLGTLAIENDTLVFKPLE